MTNTSIARPYAKAAFEYANKAGELSPWSIALRALSQAVQESTMATALANPFFPAEHSVSLLLDVLSAALDKNAVKTLQAIKNFLRLLAEYKRLCILPEILTLFEADVARDQGYLQLSVTSAYPLDDDQQAKVEARLADQLKSAVKITYQKDPEIIGGIIVRSSEWVLDDSVQGRLARLQSALQ